MWGKHESEISKECKKISSSSNRSSFCRSNIRNGECLRLWCLNDLINSVFKKVSIFIIYQYTVKKYFFYRIYFLFLLCYKSKLKTERFYFISIFFFNSSNCCDSKIVWPENILSLWSISFILPERSFNNACKSVIESFVSFVVITSIEEGA